MWCKFPELKRQATVWFLERGQNKILSGGNHDDGQRQDDIIGAAAQVRE